MNIKNRAENRSTHSGVKSDLGTYLGIVVNNTDTLYSGRLQVWLPGFGGNISNQTSWHTVSYANPFYGITSHTATKQLVNSSDTNSEEIKSYGMWTQPPEIGTKVLVVFADGDTNRGYWIAAIPEVAHGMIPAIGTGPNGKPSSEFDPSISEVQTATDLKTVERPELSSITSTFTSQGLASDSLRGFVSTSSSRESPSKVFGFNTPGGHTLFMDDGDSNGKSKLVRFRTAAGNQITMHDDNGMIYVINAKGTGWIELSPSGQIDAYGEKGFNVATKGEINMHADKDFNVHAGGNIKMVAGKNAKLQGTAELQLHGKKSMLSGVDAIHLHSCKEIIITSYKDIFMKAFNYFMVRGKCFKWNTGTPKEAEQVPPEKASEVTGYQTTVKRAPSKEPYKGHESSGSSSSSSGSASSSSSTTSSSTTTISAANTVTAKTASSLTNSISSSLTSAASSVASSAIKSGLSSLTSSSGLSSMISSATGNIASGAIGSVLGGSGGILSSVTGGLTSGLMSSATSALGNIAGSAVSGLSGISSATGAGFASGKNCERPAESSGGSGSSGGSSSGGNVNKEELRSYIKDKITGSALDGYVPSDGARYGITTGSSDEWANYFVAQADAESGFNANDSYRESDGTYSQGLFSLTVGEKGLTSESIFDWKTNTDAALSISTGLITKDGVITAQTSSGKWIGNSAYFGTLRTGIVDKRL